MMPDRDPPPPLRLLAARHHVSSISLGRRGVERVRPRAAAQGQGRRRVVARGVRRGRRRLVLRLRPARVRYRDRRARPRRAPCWTPLSTLPAPPPAPVPAGTRASGASDLRKCSRPTLPSPALRSISGVDLRRGAEVVGRRSASHAPRPHGVYEPASFLSLHHILERPMLRRQLPPTVPSLLSRL